MDNSNNKQSDKITAPPSPDELSQVEEKKLNENVEFNEQTNYLPTGKVVMVFVVCGFIDFLTLIDQTSLAPALSTISSGLGAGTSIAWIAGGYFLTSTSFQLLYGRLSDIWSRKAILLFGFGIFFFGSLAASLATSAEQLIAFRAIIGIGGGGLMTIAQAIVSDIVPLRERGKYQGIFGAFVALGNGIGPIIGGELVKSSWRWIFRLNMPLTAISVLGVLFYMPLKRVEGSWKRKVAAVDFLGAFLALSGSTLIVLALTWAGGEKLWSSTAVIASLVVGFIVCVAFVLWEYKGAALPLIRLHIFKARVVNGAALTQFINGWNFVTQVYYIPTFYQLVNGYSPVKSGALLLPVTLTQTLFSTLSGLVVHKTGRYRECILCGWAVWAIGLGLYSTLDESSGLGKQIGYGILTGFGVGQTLQPSLIAIQAGVDRKEMAVVTTFRSFIRNLGATLGLAVAGSIINNSLRSSLASVTAVQQSDIQWLLNNPSRVLDGPVRLPSSNISIDLEKVIVSSYKKGFRIVFIVGASLAALAFVFAFLLLPQVELNRADDQKLKEEGKKFVGQSRKRKTAKGAVTPESAGAIRNDSA
ncbi:putative MFS drug transporter [Lojkania enalia]|uniref:MFS drug transporter n=1 Tax=Lojkania enalia TaxID=147567 RepID=A0A9P4K0H6_9PLEO|nr:putative MFS drug transporter [Didymosphaeria enalia]